MTTPSSQITTDVIMQSSLKNLHRLILSKHDTFISSLSVYEEMLQRLDRTLNLHELFMATKQEAFNSSLSSYEKAFQILKTHYSSFESQFISLQIQFRDVLARQEDDMKTFEELMTKGAKIFCWVMTGNAVLTLALLIRWFFK